MDSSSPATPPPRTSRPRGPFALLRRLYDWTLSWAESRWGPAALAALAFSEAVFFPIPPDPLLMALVLGKPRHALRFAALCTGASVLGAVGGYFVGVWLWQAVDQFFFAYVPGFTEANFRYVQLKYEENAFLAIFAAAFTIIPFKVFTIASGVFQVGLGTLVGAGVLGRGLRFLSVALLLQWLGPRAKDFIDRHFNLLTVVFFVILALGFLLIRRFF